MRAEETASRILVGGKEPSLKITRPLIVAAAIALWCTLHLWIALLTLVYALPQFSDATQITYPTPGEVLGVLDAWLPWRLGTSIGWFLLQGFTVSLGAFWLLTTWLARMIRWFEITDIHEATGAAWSWAWRRALYARTFWLGVGLIAALALGNWLSAPVSLISLISIAAVILFLATPFLALNGVEPLHQAKAATAFAASPSLLQAASIYYSGAAILLVLSYAAGSILNESSLTGWCLGLLESTAQSWAFLGLISVLVYRVNWGNLRAELKGRFRARFLALALLLNLRVLMLSLFVAPSLLLAAIVVTYVLPQHEATLRAIGAAPSSFYQFAVSMLDYTVSYWWMLVLPMSVPILLTYARSLALFDQAEILQSSLADDGLS